MLEQAEQKLPQFGPTMSESDVVMVIMDAVRNGHWQNAMKGTRLATYELPLEQADRFGVSEVKVSVAPDGRILSAYPARGWNVLAVRELTQDELAQQNPAPQQQPAAHGQEDDRLFRTNVANTTFG